MIYFDSAATTFQKPSAVSAAMLDAMRTMSSPGRGGHSAAIRAAETTFICRSEIAELFHIENPEQVVFTHNATHGLNIAIKSVVPPGGHVVISGYEHNAVTRPLMALGADVSVAETPLFQQDVSAFENKITVSTSAVICNHISNVFGSILPVEEIAAVCRRRNIPFIIDASQSAGVLPLDMSALGAAFIAMPGHKGLYGPQGTGVLLCNPELLPRVLLEGGTGSLSLQQEMPAFLPDRLEAGTHNMPGIAGLLEGVRFVRQRGKERICQRERELALLAAEGLRSFEEVSVFAMPRLNNQTGVLSFCVQGKDSEQIGERLAEQEIAVRAGLHCAPLAHRSAGTLEQGTVRLSFSDFNTPEEVYRFLHGMKAVLR